MVKNDLENGAVPIGRLRAALHLKRVHKSLLKFPQNWQNGFVLDADQTFGTLGLARRLHLPGNTLVALFGALLDSLALEDEPIPPHTTAFVNRHHLAPFFAFFFP